MTTDYAELQQAVESAGFFTTLMPLAPTGVRVVCASHKYLKGDQQQGLGGNSFWVAKRGGEWFVAGWAPAIYRIADGERVVELCLLLLRGARAQAYADFDQHILRDFALIPLSDEDFAKKGRLR